jgi:FkbM family methyltransferase
MNLMLKRAVIGTLQPFLANHVYTVRRGLARGLRRRGGLGFMPQLGQQPLEESFLQQLDFAGQTVFDAGGYEGIFTLFFAARVGPAGRLITFEPHPRNHAHILENVRLNGFRNVEVHQLALGAAPGRATLVCPADETARGSLVGDIQEQIRQETHATPADTIEVAIDSIDRLIDNGLPEPDFVKIDVEGFERDVLEGMRGVIGRCRPRLYIEIHGADRARKLENTTSVVDFLWRSGYSTRHVETMSTIAAMSDIPRAIEGHLYCE